MAAMQLLQDFDNVLVKHVPRRMNEEANSLAQASTGLKLSLGALHKITTVQKWLLPSVKRIGLGQEVFTADPTSNDDSKWHDKEQDEVHKDLTWSHYFLIEEPKFQGYKKGREKGC